MNWDAIGTVVGGVLGLGNSIYNTWANQRDFDYQRNLQQQIFEREDTAVKRRMNDLKAAGLNPNLATGQAAQAGAVVSRSNTNDVNFGAALDTMAAVQQIRNARVQNEVARADAKVKDAEAADKVYSTMLHMGIDATPYYDKKKGKFDFSVQNDGIPENPRWNDYYHGQMAEQTRSWERNEQTFKSNMNLALSKLNLNTSQINQITNSIGLSNLEFKQRVNEFNKEYGLKINEQNYSQALRTYEELRKQLELQETIYEKTYTIKHILEQEAHMDTQEAQAWTKIILDTIGDERKTTNILSFLFSIFQ